MRIRAGGLAASRGLGSTGLEFASGTGRPESATRVGCASVGSGVGRVELNPPGIRRGVAVSATGVGSARVGSADGSALVTSGSGTGVGEATQPSGSGPSAAVGVGSEAATGVGSAMFDSTSAGSARATSLASGGTGEVVGSGASTHPTSRASEVEPIQAAARVIPGGCRRGACGVTGRPSLIDEYERAARWDVSEPLTDGGCGSDPRVVNEEGAKCGVDPFSIGFWRRELPGSSTWGWPQRQDLPVGEEIRKLDVSDETPPRLPGWFPRFCTTRNLDTPR